MVFTLKDTAYTRSMWDFAFEVRYTIELGSDSLDTTFSVLNKGDVPFQFTAALHSYWAVSTVPNITVSGPFKGASYLDKSVDPPVTRTGEANDLTISKATDSVYQDVWQHGQSGHLIAVPQLGSCAFSERDWCLWVARLTREEADPPGARQQPLVLQSAASKAADRVYHL